MLEFLQVPAPESGVWVRLPATLVIYLGIMLVLCSRNLRWRASVLYWEGILRIAVGVLLAGYGLFGDLGIAMAVVGIVDLSIGVAYLIRLPRSLNVTHSQLLSDKV